ncbi:MAG: alginate O-acetyltransferase complex protein AlgI [Gaiellaceae bacterium]|nr:alginate O-acetyltransferase complex protein AlgI [Gaiellaceae bacterium]
MLFNSYVFLFGFLPPVLVGVWAMRIKDARLLFITLASWVFYAWWDWRFLPLMLSTTTVDYVAALAIHRTANARKRNLWLIGSLAVNLGLLGYFKYASFFLNSLNGLGKAIGAPVGLPDLHILLPIGISFYTFNSMSYTIDVWRGRVEPTKHILEYSAFVALFPHLIAGPIVRFIDLQPQLRMPRPRLTAEAAGVGVYFFVCGLTKKLLLADQLSPHVDALFANSNQLGFVGSWAAAIGYALQLYFDFSGYSDMAVGLAWLIGFRFPQNFNSPYKAVNVSDFWRRWHMSLSAWFRDYLFIPLGGSRRGARRTVVNLVLTMFLAGLWHGAAWTFVVWGLAWGLALGVHGVLSNLGLTPRSLVVNRVLTFLFAVAAFVIFRAPNLHVAGTILWRMAGTAGVESWATLQPFLPGRFILLLIALLAFVQFAPNTWQVRLRPRFVYGLATGVAAALAVMSIAVPHPFIYFQF